MHDRQMAEAKARKTANVSGTIITYCPFCYLSLSAVKPDGVSDIYVLLDGSGEMAAGLSMLVKIFSRGPPSAGTR